MIEYENLAKLNQPFFAEYENVFKRTLAGGRYILGEELAQFENEFASLHGRYCLGVASGLDALILGLSVFDFPHGSKVLVPSNTYIASILAIVKAGLVPVLTEPDEHTYNLDVNELRKNYSGDCVAIMPVHLYGRLCAMPEIIEFAEEKNLKVIEDCAQSHFASINGTRAGCFGDIGAFSFYPTKNLGALGDGGAIICKDIVIYDKLKALRNYGSETKYYNKYQGWNSRLDELQAAFLRVKLKKYENIIKHKRNLAAIYLDELKEVKNLKLPLPAGEDNAWHIFNVLTDRRDALKAFLFDENIITEIHYPVPPNKQQAYQHLFRDTLCPIAEKIHRTTLSLPLSLIHTEEEIRHVAAKIRAFFS